MAMIICTNKGCRATTYNSYLDEATNEVICSECGKTISGISEFMKRSLAGMGKIKRDRSLVKCKKCAKSGKPVPKEGKFFCCFCGEKMNLPSVFIEANKI